MKILGINGNGYVSNSTYSSALQSELVHRNHGRGKDRQRVTRAIKSFDKLLNQIFKNYTRPRTWEQIHDL